MSLLSQPDGLNRAILDNIMDAVISIDAHGLITYSNQTALTLFGYSHNELLGKNIKCLMADYHADRHDSYLKDYNTSHVRSVIGNNRVLQAKHANGYLLPIELRVCELKMGDGTTYLGMIRDLRESVAKRDKINRLENTDLLTGLPNRNALLLALRDVIDTLVLQKQCYYLVMIDADDFNKINQGFGYEFGDEVLQRVATKLSEYKELQFVARVSEDEFAMLIQSTMPEKDIKYWLDSLLRHLSEAEMINGKSIACSFSAGVFTFNQPDLNSQVVIGGAETALMFSKQKQRGGVVFHRDEISLKEKASALLDQGLRSRLLIEQLFLLYQPQIDNDGNIFGFEALMRWQYQGQLVPPDVFIELAERNGAIYPMGTWLLEQACQFLCWTCQHPVLAACRLSVNVSPKQFAHPHFVSDILQVLHNNNVDPERLHLELTERLLLENPSLVIEKMRDLRACGISFSLDDFGTGYSSLAYLKNLPLSELKIDRSFVRDLTTNPSDRKIVSSILLLAQGLGLSVVTEGVETEAQLSMLKQMGCGQFQGYYYAKPLTKDQVLAFVNAKVAT